MTRGGAHRRAPHEAEEGRSGAIRGRSRGRGQSTNSSRGQRDENTRFERSVPSGSSRKQVNPSRASNGGRGRRSHRQPSHGHRHQTKRSSLRCFIHLLPEDIVAQSLLPFLVWHETSALGCVSKLYSVVVSHARDQHVQWETTSFAGDSARECLRAMAAQLGRGASGALRFAPTFAMATLAFANAPDARHTQSVWSELVDTVVAADVLPVGCALVGMLDGGLRAPTDGEDASTASVVLTISVGNLAQTVVETAAFDRKALRWSASGLTEELACPFETGNSSDEDKTSLLVWSTSAKPAQVLLSLAKQWFPSAPLAGGVVTRADHAPPLMTFKRAANSAERNVKIKAQRKMKTATHVPHGVLSFPSAILIRFQGKTSIRTLDLCLDRPLTPILRNEELTPVDDVAFLGLDIRTYAVSLVDETVGESNTHSLWAAVSHYAQQEHPDAAVGSMNLLSSTTADALRRTIGPHSDRLDWKDGVADSICSMPLHIDRLGLMTINDHWHVGQYGVVTVRQHTQELVPAIERQVEQLFQAVRRARERPLASIVLCSNHFDDESRAPISLVLRHGLSKIPGHHVSVDGEIGPIGIPHEARINPVQLQTRTVCGFVLCHSSEL
jgi:hypothetical protein